MRHAKAGELPGGPDFERGLRPRGERDAMAAGRWLADGDYQPDLVLCSAARRTRQTWQGVSQALDGRAEFDAERRLYEASSEDVAAIVRQVSDDVGTLLYIGHNPAAAGLIGLLTGAGVETPTAAIAVIGLPPEWAAAVAGSGELLARWAPRLAGRAS